MPKIDKCVVRNEAYRCKEFNIRERHNERKNEHYGNGDIIPERAHLNFHFKHCEGTYEQQFNSMLESGEISTRGLQENAKVFDEMVFDVNSAYFERNGGYEYAKQFFEEAFRLAIKEIGGEQYVLSAVMHADEKNKALSEEMGRDIYHYHLHVVYIPVVEKEVKWTKRCKDPALVGTTKEVIRQVSHSKKWPKLKQVDEHGEPICNKNGKSVLVNSYSLLQDHFYEHMKTAGYNGFERGERGSTAEHLSVLDYKIQQDKQRAYQLSNFVANQEEQANKLSNIVSEKQKQAGSLEKSIDKKEQQLVGLEKKITIVKQTVVDVQDIDKMASISGLLQDKVQLSLNDWKKVSDYAKEGITSRTIIADLKKRLVDAQKQVNEFKSKQGGITEQMRLLQETSAYREAKKLYPKEVDAFIAGILKNEHSQKNLDLKAQHYSLKRGDVL